VIGREYAISWIRGLLDDNRFYHSLRTEEMALLLAKRYHFNKMEKVSLAAILHDCAKTLPSGKALEKVRKYGIILDDVAIANPLLWHAVVGAKMVEVELGLHDEEIINAIRVHTTGDSNMSMLDKIIFIADKVEFGREYGGVDYLRELAWVDIDVAVMHSIKGTLQWVLYRKLHLHPSSVSTWNAVIDYVREC